MSYETNASEHPIVAFFSFIGRQKRTLLTTMFIFMLLGIFYVVTATPTYPVSVTVGENTRATPPDNRSVGLVFTRDATKVTDYSLFLYSLASHSTAETIASDPELMQRLFAREWNAEAGRWERPDGALNPVKDWISDLKGTQPWYPPDADRVEAFLKKQIVVSDPDQFGLTTISYKNTDPEFAMNFLMTVVNIARGTVIESIKADLDKQINYLASKITEQSNLSMQQALIREWNDKTAKQATIQDADSYPAIIIDIRQPGVSPVGPPTLVVVVAAILIGLFLGLLIAMVRSAYRQ
ncbi:hypothetical protein [uncultured Tistrella sp.]|uniref:hypothetical protein n=1 Tax=Tistrella mobilis TaxID=171437 RepID=UPI000C09A9EB|nr:hypothetical protein [uncultured Tistrella sp.]MAM74530.1 hypothetical protein [Tistrella sp.]|tara:strand:+ start:578 stop:1462 length:885 start_codon:yes stop_codon:yes gene_type:complete